MSSPLTLEDNAEHRGTAERLGVSSREDLNVLSVCLDIIFRYFYPWDRRLILRPICRSCIRGLFFKNDLTPLLGFPLAEVYSWEIIKSNILIPLGVLGQHTTPTSRSLMCIRITSGIKRKTLSSFLEGFCSCPGT